MAMRDFERDYAYCEEAQPTEFVDDPRTFQGYVRGNGNVGTYHYIGILTNVNCAASVAHYIANAVRQEDLADYPNVDGVAALVHVTGCGMADTGEGHANLQRTLSGYARHPNFSCVIMVGLGCEVNQIDFLLEASGIERGPLFRTMTIQDSGGTHRSVERGAALIREMLPEANRVQREAVPASGLTLALQCGGSGNRERRASVRGDDSQGVA